MNVMRHVRCRRTAFCTLGMYVCAQNTKRKPFAHRYTYVALRSGLPYSERVLLYAHTFRPLHLCGLLLKRLLVDSVALHFMSMPIDLSIGSKRVNPLLLYHVCVQVHEHCSMIIPEQCKCVIYER